MEILILLLKIIFVTKEMGLVIDLEIFCGSRLVKCQRTEIYCYLGFGFCFVFLYLNVKYSLVSLFSLYNIS